VISINGFWWYEVKDRDLAGRIVKAQNEDSRSGSRCTPIASTPWPRRSLQFPRPRRAAT
jgi:hypothetical protein